MTKRTKAESNVYHVIMRGVNKQVIFEDSEDRQKFINILQKYQEESGYGILGWCLMSNHVHLVMQFKDEDISTSMHKIQVSYAKYFNGKYERVGHLFQNRYASEPVENSQYFVTLIHYLHMNPVKAGIVDEPGKYVWSSFREYANGFGDPASMLADTRIFKKIAGENGAICIPDFGAEDETMELTGNEVMTETDTEVLMFKLTGIANASDFQHLDKATRNAYLRTIAKKGISVTRLSRVTGCSRGVIYRALR